MGFEYQNEPGKRTAKVTYNDDLINTIFKKKTDLKLDVETELDSLRKLLKELRKESDETYKLLMAYEDWNSDDAEKVEEKYDDLSSKVSVLEDLVDYLEELSGNL